jgi:hypothetical protein
MGCTNRIRRTLLDRRGLKDSHVPNDPPARLMVIHWDDFALAKYYDSDSSFLIEPEARPKRLLGLFQYQ